ncbi:MAG: hypothetical protein JST36_07605 [Bacteroidetes bacterium]|nr:hypothetical protein [Bacteroidota bacterium]
MHYYTHFAGSLTYKNKLHAAAVDYLKRNDGLIITNLAQFFSDLEASFRILNERHQRCFSLSLSFNKYKRDEDGYSISLGSHYDVSFFLYPIKGQQ